MSKVFMNDKGITSGYDGREKTKVEMAWHGIVENVTWHIWDEWDGNGWQHEWMI